MCWLIFTPSNRQEREPAGYVEKGRTTGLSIWASEFSAERISEGSPSATLAWEILQHRLRKWSLIVNAIADMIFATMPSPRPGLVSAWSLSVHHTATSRSSSRPPSPLMLVHVNHHTCRNSVANNPFVVCHAATRASRSGSCRGRNGTDRGTDVGAEGEPGQEGEE